MLDDAGCVEDRSDLGNGVLLLVLAMVLGLVLVLVVSVSALTP